MRTQAHAYTCKHMHTHAYTICTHMHAHMHTNARMSVARHRHRSGTTCHCKNMFYRRRLAGRSESGGKATSAKTPARSASISQSWTLRFASASVHLQRSKPGTAHPGGGRPYRSQPETIHAMLLRGLRGSRGVPPVPEMREAQ
jgi:hypothetical protein